MSFLDGISRSSYFSCTDLDAFDKVCEDMNLTRLYGREDQAGLVAFVKEEGFLSDEQEIETESGDWQTVNFKDVLAPLMADGWWIVIQSGGYEGIRYVAGDSWAFNNKGEERYLHINDIYDKLPEGVKYTAAEY